ncbi:MAG: Lrp/AsnC family transcriptional regulator [Gammaproteobacteria bacterium]|jgi:Lrp/AsnC family leucine-responsive transcriptional regulator|nr:Lrp/AsnC family transcriptional regulator [Gammaproteobacteria bacterium]
MNYSSFPSRVDLDDTDRRILQQLQRDASLSNQALAERVHLSPAPCLRRVKRLIEAGVIERTVALLSRHHLGLGVTAYAFVSLDSHRSGTEDPFEAMVRSSPEIVECVRLSGEYDYLLRIIVPSMQAYSKLLDDRLLKCRSVRSVNTSFDLGVLKQTTALPLGRDERSNT